MNIFDGTEMYKWAEDLFPICRSVAGPGNLETLGYIKKIIPNNASSFLKRSISPDYICSNDGGDGAIREFVDYLIENYSLMEKVVSLRLNEIEYKKYIKFKNEIRSKLKK